MTNQQQHAISKKLDRLVHDQRGNMTEYIILIGVIALLCIAAFKYFGESLTAKAQEQADRVQAIETPGD